MARMELRAFAKICHEAAKRNDVKGLIETQLAAGVAAADILDLVRAHKVMPLFAAALIALEITDGENIPSPAYYASYHLHLRQQLLQLERALRVSGTRVILLKGSIQLFRPLYLRSGMRQMADLDVLVEDVATLKVFSDLGYRSRLENETLPTTLDLPPGRHHLAPLWKELGATCIEPHVLPSRPEHAHLIGRLGEHAAPVPGAEALYLPDPADQLILALVHGVCGDRDSMHGGLFLRAIVELEMLFAALSPDQRQEAEQRLAARGGQGLWSDWRALADWCLHGDDMARKRSFGSARLIGEMELRHRSRLGSLAAGLANLAMNLLSIRFWRSGAMAVFGAKLSDRDFWSRLGVKLRAAFTAARGRSR